jgi:hypothetical protein
MSSLTISLPKDIATNNTVKTNSGLTISLPSNTAATTTATTETNTTPKSTMTGILQPSALNIENISPSTKLSVKQTDIQPTKTASFGEKLKNFITVFTPGGALGTAVGTILGLSSTKKQREETIKQDIKTQDTLIKSLREAEKANDAERINRTLKMLVDNANTSTSATEEIVAAAPTTKQIVAAGAELGLTALMGLKPQSFVNATGIKSGQLLTGATAKQFLKNAGLGVISESADKLSSKAAVKLVKNIGKNAVATEKISNIAQASSNLSKAFIKYGKPVIKEGIIGGAFNASLKARETDSTVKDIINAGLSGAAIFGGITGAVSGLGYGIGKAKQAFGPILSSKYSSLLEKSKTIVAGTKPVSDKSKSAVDNALQYIGESPSTTKQIAAKTILGVQNVVEKFQNKIVDRYFPAYRVQKTLEKTLGRPLTESEKIFYKFRLTDATAEQVAEYKNKVLANKLQPFDDIKREYVAYLSQLDLIERAKLGQEVAGGRSQNDLLAGLIKMTKEIGPENMKRVEEIRTLVNNFNRDLLYERMTAGLVDKQQVNAMLSAHPNYLPHSVLVDIDDLITNRVASSLNVAQTDIKKAIGSARNIENPISAMFTRTEIAQTLIERNKTLTDFVKVIEGNPGLLPGARALQTAENVTKKRTILNELKTLKQSLDKQLIELKVSKIADKKVVAKIEETISEINNYEKDVASGLSEFFNEGTISKKFIPGKVNIKITPSRLNSLELFARKTNNLQDFSKDASVLKSFTSGELERAGYTSIEDFYIKARQPLNITKSKIADTVAKSNLPKIIKGQSKIEQLKDDLTVLKNINKTSTQDSIKYLDNIINNIKATRKDLYLEALSLSKKSKTLEEQTINFMRNGIKETWVMPTDIVEMVKNFNAPVNGPIMQFISKVSGVLKAASTKYNLGFMLPNIARDKQTALVTARSFIEQMAKEAGVSPKLINLSDEEIKFLYHMKGGYGASIMKEGEINKFINSENFLEKNGFITKIKDFGAKPFEVVETINSAIEESTRLKVFRMGLEKGLSLTDAAFAAREATIDFAKMGSTMKILNQAIPFLNPRFQSLVNIPKALAANPDVFTRMMFYSSVYPTLALHQWNSQFESYKNLSQYYKNKYFCIIIDEAEIIDPYTGNHVKVPQFLTVPMGEVQTWVSSPIQYFLDKAEKLDKRSVGEMIVDTLGSASPLSFQTFSGGNPLASLVSQLGPLPTLVYGLASGQNPYYGTPIVPESRQELPTNMQTNINTPEITQKLANIMGVAPAKLEFFINSWGGAFSDAQKVIDFTLDFGDISEKSFTGTTYGSMTALPVLNRFFRESGESNSPIIQEQKKQLKELQSETLGESAVIKDKALKILKALGKIKTPDKRQEYLKELPDTYKTQEVIKKVLDLQKKQKTFEILTQNIDNKTKAKYILERINELENNGATKEEKVNFINELNSSGLITQDLLKSIAELKASGY